MSKYCKAGKKEEGESALGSRSDQHGSPTGTALLAAVRLNPVAAPQVVRDSLALLAAAAYVFVVLLSGVLPPWLQPSRAHTRHVPCLTHTSHA